MLQHYLILKKEGIPLYSFTNKLTDPHYNGTASQGIDPEKNSVLFSGLISSFVAMSTELGGSLNQVKMDNLDIYLYQSQGLIGVSLTDPSQDPSEIEFYKNHTQNIVKLFHDSYEQELVNWNGNVSMFDNFHDNIVTKVDSSQIKPAKTCKSCILGCLSKDIGKYSVNMRNLLSSS